MTTHKRKNCIHCKIPYSYQASGFGCDENYNDERYCPDCQKAIVECLSKIEVRCEKRWIKSNDYTKEQILEHKNFLDRNYPNRPRRVLVGLFDLEDSENKNIDCIVRMPNGYDYNLSYWTKTKELSITKEVNWDIKNNKEWDG